MAVIARRQGTGGRTKVKTGCATCRVRRIKCDEGKPACQRCVQTGRACDGYESLFRNSSGPAMSKVPVGVNSPPEISPRDVDLLNRILSTKTMFEVKLGCEDEARQVLRASLTNAPLRHAISSLRALRKDFETTKGQIPGMQQTTNLNYGLQQYSMALQGLVSNLSSPDSNALRSTLCCCQIFISIEQAREDYAAMAQHIIRGLKIMHEHRVRPSLDTANELLPARDTQLPHLDVFIIKLFAAPCRFADAVATTDASGTTVSVCMIQSRQQSIEKSDLRAIAPDWRGQLTRFATSTLELLTKVSDIQAREHAVRLLPEKETLLDSLRSWLTNLELAQRQAGAPQSEPISVTFLRIFHLILRIVLLGTLNSSRQLDAELQAENDRLQAVADSVSERVRLYRKCDGNNNNGRASKIM